MGLKDNLASMVSDFVELRRNPDFRSKTELSGSMDPPDPTKFNPNRRHSLQITCGTQDPQPERCVHQRTFSINQMPKGRPSKDALDSASLRQEEPLQSRRYKQRRASEPVNLLGLQLWARGSAKHRQRQRVGQSQLSDECNSAASGSPPGSPGASSGGRSPAPSLNKSGNFSRFFAHHHPIEEAEELEADMDGQRRQSQSKRAQVEQQRYATVIRL